MRMRLGKDDNNQPKRSQGADCEVEDCEETTLRKNDGCNVQRCRRKERVPKGRTFKIDYANTETKMAPSIKRIRAIIY